MPVRRYRKKPVEITAIQWTGNNLQECIYFLGDSYGGHSADRALNGMRSEIKVLTLEGNHVASKGDYIVRGVQGEYYPVKPDIFERTYDLVEESNHA